MQLSAMSGDMMTKFARIISLAYCAAMSMTTTADNEICKGMDGHSYLVPHPSECGMFYSCQKLINGNGYLAHLMQCPETTHFDETLQICNFIRALPHCSNNGKFQQK